MSMHQYVRDGLAEVFGFNSDESDYDYEDGLATAKIAASYGAPFSLPRKSSHVAKAASAMHEERAEHPSIASASASPSSVLGSPSAAVADDAA